MRLVVRNTRIHDDRLVAAIEANGVVSSRRSIMQIIPREPDFSFRHKLFLVACLATFRKDQETHEMFKTQFGFRLKQSNLDECRKWMNKLNYDPKAELKGQARKWKELWEHYQAVRKEYLEGISEIALAHPRKRVEELVKLYEAATTPRPTRVLVTKQHLLNRLGAPRFTMNGRPYMTEEHTMVEEVEIGTAINILKQIGQEAGNFVEKNETTINLSDWVKKQKRERGLDKGIEDAKVISTSFHEEAQGVPQSELQLRPPVSIDKDFEETETLD